MTFTISRSSSFSFSCQFTCTFTLLLFFCHCFEAVADAALYHHINVRSHFFPTEKNLQETKNHVSRFLWAFKKYSAREHGAKQQEKKRAHEKREKDMEIFKSLCISLGSELFARAISMCFIVGFVASHFDFSSHKCVHNVLFPMTWQAPSQINFISHTFFRHIEAAFFALFLSLYSSILLLFAARSHI